MFRIDDPTAATSLPVPEAAGTEGYFTEGSPGGAAAATVFRASWFNRVQELLRGALDAAGIVASKTGYGQLAQAIKRLAGASSSTLTGSTALTADHAGLVVVSATGGNVTLTLPAANAAGGAPIGFVFARTDATANTVTFQRAGTDVIEGATSLLLPGNGRLRLVSDGVSAWRGADGMGRLLRTSVYTKVGGVQYVSVDGATAVTAGAGTFTSLAATRLVDVELQAAGGAAGGAVVNAAGYASAGTPGGSGAYGRSMYTTGFSGGITITLGAPGAGVQGAAGGNGGTASFGALLSAQGGYGGSPGISQLGSASGGNGNAALATGANLVSRPGTALAPTFGFTTGQVGYGGGGGDSAFGPGGLGQSANLNGNAATSYGAGGGGTFGSGNSVALIGGAGGGPIMIVREFA